MYDENESPTQSCGDQRVTPGKTCGSGKPCFCSIGSKKKREPFSAAPVEGSGAQKSENSALSAESVSLGFSACKLYACILYYSSWCAGLAVCHKQKSKKARHISSHTSRNQNEGKVRRKRPQSARARVRPTPAGGPTRSQDSRIAKAAPAGMRPAGS